MASEDGLDNEHPRKHIGKLDGLPLRMRSAHYALMENFPGKPPTPEPGSLESGISVLMSKL
jgi:hypothetical protein